MRTVPLKNRVKDLLKDLDITAYQFWKDTGIAQRTAYKLYNDETKIPDPVVLAKICDTYRVEISKVVFWIPPEIS